MRIHTFLRAPLLFILLVVVASCKSPEERPLFSRVPSSHSAVTFNNTIRETDSLNILTFEYIYNGGGVGIGDVNNDGLQDILFTGNAVSNRLYLNRGGLRFEDITEKSGITTTAWCTGVSIVDINQDGLIDFYISTARLPGKPVSSNLLFVNQGIRENGIPFFKEMAATVGLADTSYCVQSAFLDYDLDGDLDAYLLTNHIEKYNRNTPYGQGHDGSGNCVDKLFRNEGMIDGMPVYKDVSQHAGILSDGWGLGIVVNDVNRDGYPDVYVANDFMANDHLYINNKNGTFTNAIDQYLKHQEHDGMGVDMADINHDALNDIIVLDMMPEDNLRQKTMFSNNPYDRFHLNLHKGYQPQYVRNVLQLNNGNQSFSDIGYLAGVYATDWSWSALLADVDNDSYRDLFITNGFRKDITDLDFVTYSNEAKRFGTSADKLKKARTAVEQLEGVRKPNCLFQNNGDLTFTNKAIHWGLTDTSYSTGAAYADLDNDGDLDLVVNNINEEAAVYENSLRENKHDSHFLRIQLKGKDGNRDGIGAKLWIYTGDVTQYAEHQLQRGYQSSVDAIEHIGLGSVLHVDSIRVVWPGGASQLRTNLISDQLTTFYQDSAIETGTVLRTPRTSAKLFKEQHGAYGIKHRASEDDFVDYKQGQPLLLHKYSQEGPGVAVGDINGDGLEDFIVGGAARRPAQVHLQQSSGTFIRDSLPVKASEDMGLLLFDADGDVDLDLYCVSGSSEFGLNSPLYQDRLYLNNGGGKFLLAEKALPPITSSGSSVVASDFDKDGDLDLFVGGQIVPTRFPETPQSYLLQNDGKGNFVDITSRVCQELARAGMVRSALWTDVDNDGWMDLALAGEWMPVVFYRNREGKSFEKIYTSATGWWNSISGGDVDNDGDVDYVVGNLGLNSLYRASESEPVTLYAKDFDDNGSMDPIVTRYIQGKEYPTHYRESMTEQMVYFRRRLTSYALYGSMSFPDLLPADFMSGATIQKVTTLSSSLIVNLGNGQFELRPLPLRAQVAPFYGSALADVNVDGNLDIIGVGNSYAAETTAGYYDAGVGICLLGDGHGMFVETEISASGFFADKDAKGLAMLNTVSGKPLWLVTNNRDSLQAFEQQYIAGIVIKLQANDVSVDITLASGAKQRREAYYGNGYLSQGSRNFLVPLDTRECIVTNTRGEKRSLNIRLQNRSRH